MNYRVPLTSLAKLRLIHLFSVYPFSNPSAVQFSCLSKKTDRHLKLFSDFGDFWAIHQLECPVFVQKNTD